MTPTLLTEYLDRFAGMRGEIAYVHRRGYRTARWTYPQVAEAAYRFARELEARGIGVGDRVMIWGENCAEWVVAFFGCLLRGAVVVPMDDIATTDFARRVAQQVEAKLLVCAKQHAGLDAALPELGLETLTETIAAHAATAYPQARVEPAHPTQIVFTSGTTAEPKGVVLSHRNILVNLVPIGEEIEHYRIYGRIFHPLRFLNLLPLSHVFGQFLGIFIPQLLPGTVIFQETLNPAETIRTIKRERISVVVTVPRLLETLRTKIERDLEAAGQMQRFRRHFAACANERFWWRWWRFRRIHREFGWKFWAFICGGAALDGETEEFWRRLGFVVIQGYGLTETTSLISVNHPFKLARGSIGTVLPGREVKLSEAGEILVRGESVAAGYWVGKELKAVRGEEGWFHTGDLGEMDAEGRLYFKGRAKDVIVTPEGLNVYPEDLEAALRRQPEVRDCVVVGLAREKNAVPCAVLILKPGVADAAGVIKRANEPLAEFQRMRHWFVWPEEDFPRTSTQKPRAGVIQEYVEAQLGGGEKPQVAAGTLAELIANVTGRAPGTVSADAGLATDLNLSSVERVELMSAIEDRYQIELNEATFTAATTLGDLEQMLRESRSGGSERARFHYPRWPHGRWVNPIRALGYWMVAWPLTQILCRPRIRGREHLRDLRAPTLVISNHITYLDVVFVLAALPHRFRRNLAVSMEGERLEAMRNPPADWSFFERWLDKALYFLIVLFMRAFPLPARAGFRESFAFMGELADRGVNLLVFPEGMRTRDGKMNPFRAGIGMLVNNLNIPVVPLRLDGLFPLKVARRATAPPGTVSVTIGPAVRFEPGTDPEHIRRELERVVAAL
jgi:long-chain acyl-CoA synthetase